MKQFLQAGGRKNEVQGVAINFNGDTVWNLKPIDLEKMRGEVKGLLIPGEEVLMAFKTVRDQLVFTDKRIIATDVQGLTSTRKSYSVLPYSKVQFFSIQMPGFGEIFADAELFLMFSNAFTAKFCFAGRVDIGQIGRVISEYVLK